MGETMWRASKILVGLVVVLAFNSASEAADTRIYTLEPPMEIRDPLARLKKGERVAEAIRTLAALDLAAPYLRFELSVATDIRTNRALKEALDGIENRAYDRN